MKRYEALADDIARSIHSGLLKPGERLPSVRETCAARKISPSTVFQAYYLLEARGVVVKYRASLEDDCAAMEAFRRLPDARRFHVEHGKITPLL